MAVGHLLQRTLVHRWRDAVTQVCGTSASMQPTTVADGAFTLCLTTGGHGHHRDTGGICLLPALSAAKGNARRTICRNNLKQINAGILMYYDDANDASPAAYHPQGTPMMAYRKRMESYVGVKGPSSPQDKDFLPARLTRFFITIVRPTATVTLPMRLSMNMPNGVIPVIGLMETMFLTVVPIPPALALPA